MDILPEIKIEESNIDVTIESQNTCISDDSCNSEKPTNNDFEAKIDAITNIKTQEVNFHVNEKSISKEHFVEVKNEVQEYQEEFNDTQQNIFHVKIEKYEEEVDNIEQYPLDPFSNVNVKLEQFHEDGTNDNVTNSTSVHKGAKHHKCDLCNEKFGHRNSLNRHIKTIHEAIKDFKCNHCHKVFGEQGNLKRDHP